MSVKEFFEKVNYIVEHGIRDKGIFSESYFLSKGNHCRYEDGGYSVYLTYEGKHYFYGYGCNEVLEKS